MVSFEPLHGLDFAQGVHDLSYLKGYGLAYPSPERSLSGGMLGRVVRLLWVFLLIFICLSIFIT